MNLVLLLFWDKCREGTPRCGVLSFWVRNRAGVTKIQNEVERLM